MPHREKFPLFAASFDSSTSRDAFGSCRMGRGTFGLRQRTRGRQSAMPRARVRPAWQHDSDPWLSKQEASAYTGRSVRTIERAVANGKLEAGGTPGKRAFRRSALDRWLLMSVVVVLVIIALIAACAVTRHMLARVRDRARVEARRDLRQEKDDAGRAICRPLSPCAARHIIETNVKRSGVSGPIVRASRRADSIRSRRSARADNDPRRRAGRSRRGV